MRRPPSAVRPTGTKGVVRHPVAIKEDIVADEEHILEDVEGEAGGVAIDVVGLDAVMGEVFFEGAIEGKRAADLVDRIVVVDAHLGRKEFPVQVRGAQEMVMGEENRFRPFQRGVER